jgi:hypothetical protein
MKGVISPSEDKALRVTRVEARFRGEIQAQQVKNGANRHAARSERPKTQKEE